VWATQRGQPAGNEAPCMHHDTGWPVTAAAPCLAVGDAPSRHKDASANNITCHQQHSAASSSSLGRGETSVATPSSILMAHKYRHQSELPKHAPISLLPMPRPQYVPSKRHTG
jgi:hypothetical protein